jgi:tricorn protease
VTVAGDMPDVRERFVNVGGRLANAEISPTGARAVFEARGEIITVPAEKGDPRNITNSPGVMDRTPGWSPDGNSVAYFSDESGEYMLHIRAQGGQGETVKIALAEKPSYYYALFWSPDSKKIAYIDCHMMSWYIDLGVKKPVRVDTGRFLGDVGGIAWSPDSKWLAYTKRLPNYLGAIFLYSTETGQGWQMTDGMSDAGNPIFDVDGKYLYFTASTDSGASLQPDIHSFSRPTSSTVYLVVLAKDVPSPLAPESDEEKGPEEKKPEAKPAVEKPQAPAAKNAPQPEAAKPTAPPAVRIDRENILQRILAVPLPARNYVGLDVAKGGVVLAIEAAPFFFGVAGAPGNTVHRYDFKARRADVVLSGIGFFKMAHNGEKYLYSQGGRWFISALRPMPPAGAPASGPAAQGPGAPTALATANIQVRVDPRAEWRQMFREAWRIQREMFYDPGLHGLDLAAAAKDYEPFLDRIVSRRDLNYLFADMMGEITVGHLSVGGGDIPEVTRIPTGLLGADYQVENGRYRFARVYSGENWNPALQAPLTQPGVNVAAGEYLLAVNGRELTAADNVYAFFENTAGKRVVLKVGPLPDGLNAREVTVIPVASEMALRNYAWIENNRRYVDKMTGGRVAYVYMPDTSLGGYTNFNRYFFAQVGKDAAIIDERFNAGGALATDIVEYLKRQMLSLVATRDGQDEVQPQGAIFGPKVMLINEFAGSGGDAMPYYFKAAGTGPLIGKRTWGGLVGRAGAPQLMDGGFVTAPSSAVWSPKGEWIAENVGIFPDIEVEQDPALVRQGKDPQLDKAIEVVLAELARNPLPKPKRPAYPDYHKK